MMKTPHAPLALALALGSSCLVAQGRWFEAIIAGALSLLNVALVAHD
jgi:hypothetical protein